jgi:hypothetical protein
MAFETFAWVHQPLVSVDIAFGHFDGARSFASREQTHV